ncbi:hypothetical protein I7S93_29190 (plasmid) [Klebsiella pneumoniae]|nr:hypothetical protein I7S93_29190 [Klebsiella pneumoniae]
MLKKGDSRPAGFTAGGNSREAVIRFPKETGQKPVYVSVTDVLTPGTGKTASGGRKASPAGMGRRSSGRGAEKRL